MTSIEMSIRRLADAYFPLLLSHLWSSTLFLLLVLVVMLASRTRLTADARFSLALIGILKFAIPGAIVMPLIRLTGVDVLFRGPQGPLPVPLQLLGGSFRFDPTTTAPGPWAAIVIAVWLAVALAVILRFALTRHRLVSLSVRTALPPHPREVEALSRARQRVGVRRGIDIARSALPEAPAVLRIFRPLVVLPAGGCDDLSDDELESLLCHECAHVARNDNLIARIESFICALFWFHPLIWIAQRITVIERERACDEVVAESADERETYLAALTKFCHAAIAPRLPGVSCMATAKLKERMDHVMNYPALKTQSPSLKRVTFLATASLVLFTVASGIVGGDRALAGTTKKVKDPYAIKITATRAAGVITLLGTVSENKTRQVIAAPLLTLEAGKGASTRTSGPGLEVVFEVHPDTGDQIAVHVTIEKEGALVQRSTLLIMPTEREALDSPPEYTGDPISLTFKDAGLRDVIRAFGNITNLAIEIDPSVEGTVSVSWQNVPWDQALDSLLKENGLTYRVEAKTIHVSKK